MQKIDILKSWFNIAKHKNPDAYEIKIEEVAEMLVSKGLVSDIDTGIKAMHKALGSDSSLRKLTFELFQRIFCRSLFKESLIDVVEDIKI